MAYADKKTRLETDQTLTFCKNGDKEIGKEQTD